MKNFVGLRSIPKLLYHRPKDVQELLRLLREFEGECKIVAGCTDVIPAIRRGAWSFQHGLNVLDIKTMKELNFVSIQEDTIRIGAATKLSFIVGSPIIRKHAPMLAEAVNRMASLQVRNAASIGGNLCMASPAADTAPPLLALDARVQVRREAQERLIPLTDFFTGPGQSILERDEVLTEIQFPIVKPDERCFGIKLGRRNAFTLSVVSVATWVRVTDGRFEGARIALGAVAPTPVRALKAERFIAGKPANTDVVQEAAGIAASESRPISDPRASAEYRKDMVEVLTKRALLSCLK